MSLSKSDIEAIVKEVVEPLNERVRNLKKSVEAHNERKAEVEKQAVSKSEVGLTGKDFEDIFKGAVLGIYNKPIKKQEAKELTVGQKAHMLTDYHRKHENELGRIFASDNAIVNNMRETARRENNHLYNLDGGEE